MKLKNKVAIVTGAAHGIGLAIARRYVAEGARVTIADVDAPAGEAAARALGEHARFVATDVGDARAAEHVVAETCRAFGALDILVNNAGIIHAADFLELKEADFERVLRVNLKGAFLLGQAAARRMVAQVNAGKRPGSILNISSINAVVAIANHAPYCVSKGGVDQLTKVMALALAPHGIRVNAIGPGSIMTDILKAVATDKEAKRRILA
ncbi:MAG TPA: SDR family oxidoreductase, partial [Xanthobacteraceae bacterium]